MSPRKTFSPLVIFAIFLLGSFPIALASKPALADTSSIGFTEANYQGQVLGISGQITTASASLQSSQDISYWFGASLSDGTFMQVGYGIDAAINGGRPTAFWASCQTSQPGNCNVHNAQTVSGTNSYAVMQNGPSWLLTINGYLIGSISDANPATSTQVALEVQPYTLTAPVSSYSNVALTVPNGGIAFLDSFQGSVSSNPFGNPNGFSLSCQGNPTLQMGAGLPQGTMANCNAPMQGDPSWMIFLVLGAVGVFILYQYGGRKP
ncbi:MAG: hypothetical protein KGI38_11840 [Thaumarchaeota archaeon]|nr:hypothetical protein [Nitrososphaerota archaeon]